mmetsp:Transcript_33291/g.30240  ORF Transcript_33291/g.30240 Transcript_33291/m.30240 type:complete len:114 (+) Transcript_33291:4127-4468(+)
MQKSPVKQTDIKSGLQKIVNDIKPAMKESADWQTFHVVDFLGGGGNKNSNTSGLNDSKNDSRFGKENFAGYSIAERDEHTKSSSNLRKINLKPNNLNNSVSRYDQDYNVKQMS